MKKTNGKAGYLKKGGLVVITSMGMLLLTGCGAETINLNDYVTVTYSGINSKGEARIDDSAVEKAVKDIIFEKAKKGSDINEAVDRVIEAYHLELDQEKELSNGDEVKVTGAINNELSKSDKIKFTFDEYTDTVSGLKEVPVYGDDDLFAGVEVTFGGISPSAEAHIANNTDNQDIKNMSIHISPYKNLKVGDTVTVTIDAADTKRYLIDPDAVLAKDYTVEGLPEYVYSQEELTDAVKQAAMPVAEDKIDIRLYNTAGYVPIREDGRYNNYGVTSYENLKLAKILLLTPEGGVPDWNRANNFIYYVYSFDLQSDSKNAHDVSNALHDVWVAGRTQNIYVNADGTVETILKEDIELTDFYTEYESLLRYEITDRRSKYDVREITVQ